MQRRSFVLGLGGIVGVTSIGAIAYASADVTRAADIEIVADDEALIGLSPGDTDAVTLEDGHLTIDTATGDSDGLNGDATFKYGDDTDPTNTYAFSITNNDTTSRSFTFKLTGFDYANNASLEITLHQDAENSGEVLTPEDSLSVDLSEGQSIYATISIDTTDITAGNNMSGDLEISAGPTNNS